MTCEELCESFGAPADTPAADLLAAWERRRADLAAALAGDGLAKPVKLRLREELRRLEAGADVAGQLRLAAQIDGFLREAAAEWARPAPSRSVLQLCLGKAKPLLDQLPDGPLRFGCEKRLAAATDRLRVPLAEPPMPPVDPPHQAAAPAKGTVLEITRAGGALVARFIARPSFTLGRRSSADLATRFLPDTEENRRRTSTISRIQATLYCRGGQIWIRDGELVGDGTHRPSMNGTLLEEQRLNGVPAVIGARSVRLRLGQFGFEVRATYEPGSETTFATQQATVAMPDQPTGCVRFYLPDGGGAAPDIWLFTEADLPCLGGAIHFRAGGFWWVKSHPGSPRDVIALKPADRIEWAGEPFDAKIS